MLDFWSTENNDERDDGLNFTDPVIKFSQLKGGKKSASGEIHPHKEVLSDIIERLTDQLPSMKGNVLAGDVPMMEYLAAKKAAASLANKLRSIKIPK